MDVEINVVKIHNLEDLENNILKITVFSLVFII